MKNNNLLTDPQESQQLVISYELLCLLRWIIEYDSEKIKQIIAKALPAGLKQDIQDIDNPNSVRSLEDIQQSMIEFFSMLEAFLLESMHEQEVQNTLEKNLMPAIDHIDSTICDDNTVRSSIETVASRMKLNPQKNAQELLFEELLRLWQPDKKKKILN